LVFGFWFLVKENKNINKLNIWLECLKGGAGIISPADFTSSKKFQKIPKNSEKILNHHSKTSDDS